MGARTLWEHLGNLMGTHWEEEKKKPKNPSLFAWLLKLWTPKYSIQTYEDVQISWPSFIVLKRQKKFSTLHIRLGFPCLARLVISMHMRPCHRIWCGYTYFIVFRGKNAWSHMMQFEFFSIPLLKMLGVMFCANKHMFSQCHFSYHHGDKWILCL